MACFAATRLAASMRTMPVDGGKHMVAVVLPDTTANQVPSITSSTATLAAWRAALILLDGRSIDPDVSMISITAASAAPLPAEPAPVQVTETTACTSVASAARYSFWNTLAVKSAIGQIVLSCTGSSGTLGLGPPMRAKTAVMLS